jgi:hypothetical protein
MAYYIFLKSLRSLEEFRKNPHVKIPPKSPSAIFQSLAKFENPIFNSEILLFSFPHFRPTRPAFPHWPWPTGRPSRLAHPGPPASQPLGLHADGVFCKIRFLLDFAHSVSSAFSLSAADTWAPPVICFFSTEPTAPRRRATAPPHPAPPLPRLGYLGPLPPRPPSLLP